MLLGLLSVVFDDTLDRAAEHFMGCDVVCQHGVQRVEVFGAGGGVREVVEVIQGLRRHPKKLLQQSKVDCDC